MVGLFRPLLACLGLAVVLGAGCLEARTGAPDGQASEGGDEGPADGDGGGSGSSPDLAVSDCGPAEAIVTQVVDGDTFDIEGGERIRVLLVDTPEMGWSPECYAPEATAFTRSALEGQQVRLTYDVECRDKYDRLLAYVERVSDDGDLNRALVAYGYACVLHIPPNGSDYVDEFRALEAQAEAEGKGMWGTCSKPC